MLELGWPVIALGALLATAEPPAPTSPNGYGQVETFQPGKRYNCVPTADHKGWDCREIGADGNPVPKPRATEKAKPAPRPSEPTEPATPTGSVQPAAGNTAPASRPVKPTLTAPAAPAAAAAAPEKTQQSSSLPGYLTNPSTRGFRRTMPEHRRVTTPAQPASAPAPAETKTDHSSGMRTSASTPPIEAGVPAGEASKSTHTAPQENASAAPPPAAAANPRPAPTPPLPAEASPPRASNAAAASIHDEREFLGLPARHFIVELAHAGTRAGLDESALSTLPRGKVYRLHLHQFGNDEWLLVWGDFPDVDAARAARSDLVASGKTAGWPRLIAPLQAEVHRAMKSTNP